MLTMRQMPAFAPKSVYSRRAKAEPVSFRARQRYGRRSYDAGRAALSVLFSLGCAAFLAAAVLMVTLYASGKRTRLVPPMYRDLELQ
jgi:hypothetical protein